MLWPPPYDEPKDRQRFPKRERLFFGDQIKSRRADRIPAWRIYGEHERCRPSIEAGAGPADQSTSGNFCRAFGVRRCIRKAEWRARQDVGCGPGTSGRSAASAMGKNKEWAGKDYRYSEEGTNRVSRHPKEDRRRTTRSMGKDEDGQISGYPSTEKVCRRAKWQAPSSPGAGITLARREVCRGHRIRTSAPCAQGNANQRYWDWFA